MSQPTGLIPPAYATTPRGMSTFTKVLLVLLIGAGLLSMITCGAIGVVAFSGARFAGQVIRQVVEQAYSPDPVVAAELTQEIAQVAIPSRFRPRGSFNLRVPNTELPLFVCAWYQSDAPDGFLALAELDEDNTGASREALHETAKLYLQSNEHQDINVESAEEREYVIRGQQAWFEVAQGHGQQNPDEKFVRVLGSFPGKHGPGLFIYFATAEGFDEQEVTKIIESIE